MTEHDGGMTDLYVPGVRRVTKEQIHLARLTVCDTFDTAEEASEMLEMLGLIRPDSGLLADD